MYDIWILPWKFQIQVVIEETAVANNKFKLPHSRQINCSLLRQACKPKQMSTLQNNQNNNNIVQFSHRNGHELIVV